MFGGSGGLLVFGYGLFVLWSVCLWVCGCGMRLLVLFGGLLLLVLGVFFCVFFFLFSVSLWGCCLVCGLGLARVVFVFSCSCLGCFFVVGALLLYLRFCLVVSCSVCCWLCLAFAWCGIGCCLFFCWWFVVFVSLVWFLFASGFCAWRVFLLCLRFEFCVGVVFCSGSRR